MTLIIETRIDNNPHNQTRMTMNATAIEQIGNQWFVAVDATDIDSRSLRFSDRGNGPELVAPDGVFGPFGSQQEAADWLLAYESQPAQQGE